MSSFSINTKIFFGKNSTDDINKYLDSLGIKKLQLIIDKSLKNSEILNLLIGQYKQYGKMVINPAYIDATKEPTYDYLDSLVDMFRDGNFEVIIGIGGGTILDIAKGIGILLKNPGKAIGYRGMDLVTNKGIPVICYPSTAGTGSEVTHTASFIDTESQTKLGINGRYVAPLCGVLYPELTFSCPDRVTIGAGLDAMLHAIEAVSARTATPLTSMLGSKAFSILYSNFRKVISEPNNYNAREGMLLGSYYAGIAMMNAGGGPASGISYPLGVHYGVPHGIAGGIFLPHVFEYNVNNEYLGYAEVYDQLPDAEHNLDMKEKSINFLKKVDLLYSDICVPKKLSDWGWHDIDSDILTNLTIEQRKANLDLNPVAFGRLQTYELINKVV
jgi:alcohol dehydrogenase class IV